MSKWISVKDKMPNNGEYVLVVSIESIVSESCYSHKVFWHPYYGQDITSYFTGVTHWMKLPKPPTKS